jgi:hypothetical protein
VDLGDGPEGVLGDEGVGIGGGGVECGEVFGGASVAEGDADVAEEGGAFDAFDRAFGEEGAEGGVVEGEEVAEAVLEDGGSGLEGGLAGGLGEAVPGAGVEAVVATVDAAAEGAAEFGGDGAFGLDGEVGEAAAGVHAAGRGDGLGGAGGDAAGAGAAVVAGGRIGIEVEGGDDFGEEEPGAEAAVDLHGALAIPAEAGLAGEVALENGAGVHVMALGAAEAGEEGVELPEAFFDEVVVVVVPGVAGDAVGAVPLGPVRALPVGGGEDDEGSGAGDDVAGVGAALGVAGEPGHVSVFAVGDPLLEDIAVGGREGGGDAAVGEAEVEGELADEGLGIVWHRGKVAGDGRGARFFWDGGGEKDKGGVDRGSGMDKPRRRF